MYADTDFYTNTYHGKLTGTELEKALRRADYYIGTLILCPPDTVPDCVKYAVCEIADLYAIESSRDGISSESNDGYSVSYDKSKTFESKAFDIAYTYLSGTGLLFRGTPSVFA
ncbi:MAG: hypothetical protein IJ007_00890 [Oscillospiraceae bacterium]|nr:hypothetical protein [Oscillospiraceae bacterium]